MSCAGRRFDSMFHREFFLLGRRLAVTGSAWLKTQSVIFLMTSSLSMLGLLLIGNPYYILGGIGIGVLDALPIFGTGTALCRGVSFYYLSGSGDTH